MKIRRRNPDTPSYALPTLFTVGTLFCGYYTLMKTLQAVALPASEAAQAAQFFDFAAISIGIAVFTDGLDGRIARMTKSTSEFGAELDSLADCITFGAAPAALAFAWGMRGLGSGDGVLFGELLRPIGYLCTFLFLTCGAARLARFNVQQNPRPKNPGRPDRKYFVGLPIPPAAGLLAAIVHARSGYPIESWLPWGILWCALIAGMGALMISGWRYRSFKDMNFMQKPSLGVVFFATMIFLIWNFSRPVLLTMAATFVLSGIVTRIAGLWRRTFARAEEPTQPTPDTPT